MIAALKSKGMSAIGVAGFCWGGKIFCIHFHSSEEVIGFINGKFVLHSLLKSSFRSLAEKFF